jgi:hypothetical protein
LIGIGAKDTEAEGRGLIGFWVCFGWWIGGGPEGVDESRWLPTAVEDTKRPSRIVTAKRGKVHFTLMDYHIGKPT